MIYTFQCFCFHPFIYSSIYPFIYPSVFALFFYWFNFFCILPSFYLFIQPFTLIHSFFTHSFIHFPSIQPSIHPSIHLSIHPSVNSLIPPFTQKNMKLLKQILFKNFQQEYLFNLEFF